MIQEQWRNIPDFSNYDVSNFGRIYNSKRDVIMQTSRTSFGHIKITMSADWDGKRYTRSVAQLVAQAFVAAPNYLCDHVVQLDGNLSNVMFDNLAWRPRGFAWKYTHQLKCNQPIYYKNLPVMNMITEAEYDCIIDAGMSEGLLFDDIWRSTYTGAEIFPDDAVFEVIDREL